MPTNTIRLHRVLRAAPRESTKRSSIRKQWRSGYHRTDSRQSSPHGGQSWRQLQDVVYKFRHGKSHSFGGKYIELTPNACIRYSDAFDDPNLPGEIHATITLKKVSCGTELNIVQEGVPDVIPAEACYLGWQESLTLLAKLVEAEIPD
jgi:uncharacterized protein YndB with AHSA1/START domain